MRPACLPTRPDTCAPAPCPPFNCRRVLLFSTMTKLLDLLGDYLNWRKLPEVGGCGWARCWLWLG